ncbi:hypothetical protein CRUP_029199, partial [Coryphaenoides rupestris]
GWLLLLGCLCAFAPSPKMEKHMLKFVSDHAPVETQALLQHRLIQANQKAQQSSGSTPETARTYPPTLLEWTANRKKASMVLQLHCFDGECHYPGLPNSFCQYCVRVCVCVCVC